MWWLIGISVAGVIWFLCDFILNTVHECRYCDSVFYPYTYDDYVCPKCREEGKADGDIDN